MKGCIEFSDFIDELKPLFGMQPCLESNEESRQEYHEVIESYLDNEIENEAVYDGYAYWWSDWCLLDNYANFKRYKAFHSNTYLYWVADKYFPTDQRIHPLCMNLHTTL